MRVGPAAGRQEQRREVMHLLMQQARHVYWKAVGVQRMERLVGTLLSEAEAALASWRNIECDGSERTGGQLAYQRKLIGLVLQLEAIYDHLLQANSLALCDSQPGY